jgi:Protein of unknown function (DUF5661)
VGSGCSDPGAGGSVSFAWMHLRGGSIEKNLLTTITGRLVLLISNIGITVSSLRNSNRYEKMIHNYFFKTKEVVKMAAMQHFTTEQALEIGNKLGIDWGRLNVEQFRMGLNVELEHGLNAPSTDVTGNDPILTGKIALAHLNEYADYYTRLKKMEREAKE